MHVDKRLSLTLAQLEYFVRASEAQTWSAAADQLGVSPSALSQGIAELERRLGMKLFDQVGRTRTLTHEAAGVLRYATSVLAQTADLARWIDDRNQGAVGRLRLGMIDVAAVHHFSAQLKQFKTERPEVDFQLTVASSARLLSLVQRGELDLAVAVRSVEQPPDLDFIELMTEQLVVYAGPAAVDARPETWGPWIAFPPSSHTQQLVEARLRELGAAYEVVAESHQPDVMRNMVHIGLGWAVLPVVQAESGPHPLTPARQQALVERSIVAARRSRANPHPLVEDFLARLES